MLLFIILIENIINKIYDIKLSSSLYKIFIQIVLILHYVTIFINNIIIIVKFLIYFCFLMKMNEKSLNYKIIINKLF